MCNSGILCGCSYVILITLLQLALISRDKYAVVFNADSRAVINIQANGISSEVFEQASGGGDMAGRVWIRRAKRYFDASAGGEGQNSHKGSKIHYVFSLSFSLYLFLFPLAVLHILS